MTRSLPLLNATDDLPGDEVLRLALQEAVAEVGGLGGLVHLRGPQTSPGLHLAASSGLPADVTRRWQEIPDDATAAPAAAARLRRTVWLPAPEGPGTGMASVPLPAAHGAPLGTLTVVTRPRVSRPRGSSTPSARWPDGPPSGCNRAGPT